MTRATNLENIAKLAIMFHNTVGGLSIYDIQQYFNCSRRSAERMKATLFNIFPNKIEVVKSFDKKKRWRFIRGIENPLIAFSRDDFANIEYLHSLAEFNKQKDIYKLVSKIKALASQKKEYNPNTDILSLLETDELAFKSFPRFITDNALFEKIRLAILSQRKIKIKYLFNDAILALTINPYGVIIDNKIWLVGDNEYLKDFRLYKTDDIKELNILNESFEPDRTFSLQEYYQNSFYKYQNEVINVYLEFDHSIIKNVLKYTFHPAQKFTMLKNGNLRVRFPFYNTQELFQELFRWGDKVAIKSPAAYRKLYKKHLAKIMNNF